MKLRMWREVVGGMEEDKYVEDKGLWWWRRGRGRTERSVVVMERGVEV